MGAGALPGVGADHPSRPPIPIVGLDEAAMAAARSRDGHDAVAVWLAGVTGSEHPTVSARTVVATTRLPRRDPAAEPALGVAEVAQAVDEGRALAAAAAAAGATLVVGATDADLDLAVLCLATVLTGHDPASLDEDEVRVDACRRALARHPGADRGPLHALRRLGTGELAVLCGLALGAGEHGLGYVCDGVGPAAGAAVAVGIEPDVRRRLAAAQPAPIEAHEALLDHLGLVPLADDAAAVLERLRRGAATLQS